MSYKHDDQDDPPMTLGELLARARENLAKSEESLRRARRAEYWGRVMILSASLALLFSALHWVFKLTGEG